VQRSGNWLVLACQFVARQQGGKGGAQAWRKTGEMVLTPLYRCGIPAVASACRGQRSLAGCPIADKEIGLCCKGDQVTVPNIFKVLCL
jgi:hypothetical protein